jgi:hypothetical protein
MGSNAKLQVALGKDLDEEYRPGLSKISDRIHGNVGLFFTSLPREEVQEPWLVVSTTATEYILCVLINFCTVSMQQVISRACVVLANLLTLGLLNLFSRFLGGQVSFFAAIFGPFPPE